MHVRVGFSLGQVDEGLVWEKEQPETENTENEKAGNLN